MHKLHSDYFGDDNRQSTDSHEYFELFTAMVEERRKTKGSGDGLYAGLRQLLAQVRDMVKSEQEAKSKLTAPETPEEEKKADYEAKEKENLCVDLIRFTRTLVRAAGQEGRDLTRELDLVRRYFEDYLFASHYSQSAQGTDAVAASDVIEQTGSRAGDKKKSVVSSATSRKAAFDLLVEFVGEDQSVLEKFIRENLHGLVTGHMPVPEKWGQHAFVQSSRYQKFVGLRNMGATCYMNSILQQFFMIPSFRYNVLGLEKHEAVEKFDKKTRKEKEEEGLEGTAIDDKQVISVNGDITLDGDLYQLQRLVANLECSEQQVYDTEPLCYTYWQLDEEG